MYDGRIVESGDTENVFAAPEQDYTRTLLAANLMPDTHAKASERSSYILGTRGTHT
jgi:ABC-type dipeptide/oligopeptide/nickel transport system ATPase component